jgi:hypothetical protein
MHSELYIAPNAAAIAACARPVASSPCPKLGWGKKRGRNRTETLSCCSLGTGVNFRELEERLQWPGEAQRGHTGRAGGTLPPAGRHPPAAGG